MTRLGRGIRSCVPAVAVKHLGKGRGRGGKRESKQTSVFTGGSSSRQLLLLNPALKLQFSFQNLQYFVSVVHEQLAPGS